VICVFYSVSGILNPKDDFRWIMMMYVASGWPSDNDVVIDIVSIRKVGERRDSWSHVSNIDAKEG
jgi:hypothetical protein